MSGDQNWLSRRRPLRASALLDDWDASLTRPIDRTEGWVDFNPRLDDLERQIAALTRQASSA